MKPKSEQEGNKINNEVERNSYIYIVIKRDGYIISIVMLPVILDILVTLIGNSYIRIQKFGARRKLANIFYR